MTTNLDDIVRNAQKIFKFLIDPKNLIEQFLTINPFFQP